MQDATGLIAALSGAVGRQHVVSADDDQEPYLVDWRGRYRGRAAAVVKPARALLQLFGAATAR
jgi:hypothetical protein